MKKKVSFFQWFAGLPTLRKISFVLSVAGVIVWLFEVQYPIPHITLTFAAVALLLSWDTRSVQS